MAFFLFFLFAVVLLMDAFFDANFDREATIVINYSRPQAGTPFMKSGQMMSQHVWRS